jgi:hypothetical protein
MKAQRIESFEDLEVYQKLCQLHLDLNKISLQFPQFELYELGSGWIREKRSFPEEIRLFQEMVQN